jgi:GMP synthase (glutamine-hydrolysing)
MQLEPFKPQDFIEKQVQQIRKLIGSERALVAVSGGVDSVTSAVLTHKAIGKNLSCVMLDDAFMRENEPQHIARIVSEPPLNLPITVLNVQERFLKALEGLEDAEKKRKAFREIFYTVLGETAKKENCSVLVQGTIKADVMETTGGIKTQHNVLEQMGIDTTKSYGFKVVEPLVSLFKEQVRKVARQLGVPSELAERQPFPGPGLAVRIVGEIRKDKLASEKRATAIVESHFAKHKPSQYLAATFDNKTSSHPAETRLQETAARFLNVPSRHVTFKVLEARGTGVKEGKRRYGTIVTARVWTMDGGIHNPPIPSLVALQTRIVTEDPSLTRVLYLVRDVPEQRPYIVTLRAIQTVDYLTAAVSEIPWTTLNEAADEILKTCSSIAAVYYDVTPKPPATVEME